MTKRPMAKTYHGQTPPNPSPASSMIRSARSRSSTPSSWGAQTERSQRNFRIGTERMPLPVVHALAMVKLAAARDQSRSRHPRPPQGNRDRARRAARCSTARWTTSFRSSCGRPGPAPSPT